jgi:biotin transport system substrate-specific component
MHSLLALNYPLQSTVWSNTSSILKQVLLVAMGVFILAISAQISIPLEPVPLTFQSATVILLGMIYGPRLGAYIVATYLAVGAAGLPVFSNMSFGLSVLTGATAGYLIGFLPAAICTGYLAQNGWARNAFTSFMAATIGASIVFIYGVVGLAVFIGFSKAYTLGVEPFLITETLKLGMVALIAPRFWKA